jgi:hypothetical protein
MESRIPRLTTSILLTLLRLNNHKYQAAIHSAMVNEAVAKQSAFGRSLSSQVETHFQIYPLECGLYALNP